jgi:hypothetical protein
MNQSGGNVKPEGKKGATAGPLPFDAAVSASQVAVIVVEQTMAALKAGSPDAARLTFWSFSLKQQQKS